MTRAELIAALRRGEMLPAEMLAAIADYLEPPKRGRGRPRRDGEKELAEVMALIGRVETLSASLGTRQRAFNALASGRMHAATVENCGVQPPFAVLASLLGVATASFIAGNEFSMWRPSPVPADLSRRCGKWPRDVSFASSAQYRAPTAKHLDEALRYILGHDGVWNTTADDIAECCPGSLNGKAQA